MSEISNNLAALAVVLETAEKHGLPVPYVATANGYEPKVQLYLDELRTWVEWLGSDVAVDAYESDEEHVNHHIAYGDFNGSRVAFIAVERISKEA